MPTTTDLFGLGGGIDVGGPRNLWGRGNKATLPWDISSSLTWLTDYLSSRSGTKPIPRPLFPLIGLFDDYFPNSKRKLQGLIREVGGAYYPAHVMSADAMAELNQRIDRAGLHE